MTKLSAVKTQGLLLWFIVLTKQFFFPLADHTEADERRKDKGGRKGVRTGAAHLQSGSFYDYGHNDTRWSECGIARWIAYKGYK